MKKHNVRFRFNVVSVLARAMLAFVLPVVTLPAHGQAASLLAAPVVRSHDHVATLTLHAVRGNDGRDSFGFNGHTIAPIIRVSPGDTLRITYVNDLPKPSGEQCSIGPCMNMTNLHFHGLGVSPKAQSVKVKIRHVHTWTDRALLARRLWQVIHIGNSQSVYGRNTDDWRYRVSIEPEAVAAIIPTHRMKRQSGHVIV